MAAERLMSFLEEQEVEYRTQEHPEVYTAQEVAASEHVSGWLVAKPVLLEANGELAMVVLPAPLQVDLKRAAEELGASEVRLARERDFASTFPDCEPGAEPPFGHLYGVPTYVDRALLDDPVIVFRDGTHTGTVEMSTEDYRRLVEAEEVQVGVPVD